MKECSLQIEYSTYIRAPNLGEALVRNEGGVNTTSWSYRPCTALISDFLIIDTSIIVGAGVSRAK